MSEARPSPPACVRRVREESAKAPVPLVVHPVWREAFPWLVQGTTGRGSGGDYDLGLFGEAPVGAVLERWRTLRAVTGLPRAVHSRQVHGSRVAEHDGGPPGVLVMEDHDGHVTGAIGSLLTVSLADCVPISLVDPARRRVALLHGGWRGTADGIVPAGIAALGSPPASLYAHLGPAICGRCYEVGPEVHEALDLDVPDGPTEVDVRAVQAHQLVEQGVEPGNITISEHCTRCGDGFFSHRGGDRGRQLGLLGLR